MEVAQLAGEAGFIFGVGGVMCGLTLIVSWAAAQMPACVLLLPLHSRTGHVSRAVQHACMFGVFVVPL